MRRGSSLPLASLALALLVGGCGEPGRKSMWNVVEDMQGTHKAFAPEPVKVERPRALKAVKDEDMPCLKSCHGREKWATGTRYPHLKDEHKNSGKHCVDCHALGHRSAKVDRTVCKECH